MSICVCGWGCLFACTGKVGGELLLLRVGGERKCECECLGQHHHQDSYADYNEVRAIQTTHSIVRYREYSTVEYSTVQQNIAMPSHRPRPLPTQST